MLPDSGDLRIQSGWLIESYFFPFIFQVCQFVLTSVISGLMPARMMRFVWKMFLKTITSLFMVKTSALPTGTAQHTKQCTEMAKTSVRKCGQGPTNTQSRILTTRTAS